MKKIKNALKSVRIKLFMTISSVILLIILFLILVNNFVFGKFYLYSKTKALKSVYEVINEYYKSETNQNIDNQLENLSTQNNFDILIIDNHNINVYTTNKNFLSTIDQMTNRFSTNKGETIEEAEKFTIRQMQDSRSGITYIMLSAVLDNGYLLYIRIPINSIQESVKISNNFLYLMAGFTILISAVIVSYVSRKFTDPILELNAIAKKMANLDFSHKYKTNNADDE